MSVTIKYPNYDEANIKERSNLAVATQVGDTTITLFSNNSILNGDPGITGRLGSETAEMHMVTGTNGASEITLETPLDHPHEFNAAFTALRATQIKVYRAESTDGAQPADDAFTFVIALDMDYDQNETVYTDPDGEDSHWYKYSYFNNITEWASPLSTIAIRGGRTSYYATVDDVRDDAGFRNNPNINDTKVITALQEAQAYINGELSGRYTIPFTAPINPHVSKLTKTLAAGYLQLNQYGTFNIANSANGNEKTKWVESQLALIKSGQLVLTNPDGSSPTQPAKSTTNDLGFSGWPNSTTADVPAGTPGAGDHLFKISSIAGYGTREY